METNKRIKTYAISQTYSGDVLVKGVTFEMALVFLRGYEATYPDITIYLSIAEETPTVKGD